MVYGEPKFPVVNPSPSIGEAFGAMSAGDYFSLAALTGLGVPVGILGGASIFDFSELLLYTMRKMGKRRG